MSDERNLVDKGAVHTPRNSNAKLGSPEWEADNAREIAERPGVLPLNQRKYPYGRPDRLQPKSNF